MYHKLLQYCYLFILTISYDKQVYKIQRTHFKQSDMKEEQRLKYISFVLHTLHKTKS